MEGVQEKWLILKEVFSLHQHRPLTKSVFRSILHLSTFTTSVDTEMLTHFRIGDLERNFFASKGKKPRHNLYFKHEFSVFVDQLFSVQIARPEVPSLLRFEPRERVEAPSLASMFFGEQEPLSSATA